MRPATGRRRASPARSDSWTAPRSPSRYRRRGPPGCRSPGRPRRGVRRAAIVKSTTAARAAPESQATGRQRRESRWPCGKRSSRNVPSQHERARRPGNQARSRRSSPAGSRGGREGRTSRTRPRSPSALRPGRSRAGASRWAFRGRRDATRAPTAGKTTAVAKKKTLDEGFVPLRAPATPERGTRRRRRVSTKQKAQADAIQASGAAAMVDPRWPQPE